MGHVHTSAKSSRECEMWDLQNDVIYAYFALYKIVSSQGAGELLFLIEFRSDRVGPTHS